MGCRYHPSIVCSQFFSVNPDRRRRLFNSSPCGMYAPGCGLAEVTMSWSAPEYLHMVRAPTFSEEHLSSSCYEARWSRSLK